MKKLIPLAVLVCAFAAQAQEPGSTAAPAPTLGVDTRAWLELQTSGSASVSEVRPVAGEVATEVYQRYVNSFKYAIPETFPRDAFVSQGGSK